MPNYPLLKVRNLVVSTKDNNHSIPLVKKVSFSINSGESLAIVGQSGCGKTMTAKAITGLLPKDCEITCGDIFFKSAKITLQNKLSSKGIRGTEIGFVFQHPSSSLNPSMKIGDQMTEAPRYHLKISRAEAKELVLHFLEKVKIPFPEKIFRQYPFELSGGMQQRVAIAMALSCKPDLIIADEPTTALDSLSQFEVLKLLIELKEEYGLALILITHNLAIIPEICSKMLVMENGILIEQGAVNDLFSNPQMKLTQTLLEAVPKIPYQFRSHLHNQNAQHPLQERELEFFLNEASLISKRIGN